MLCNTQHAQTFYDVPQNITRHKHSHLAVSVSELLMCLKAITFTYSIRERYIIFELLKHVKHIHVVRSLQLIWRQLAGTVLCRLTYVSYCSWRSLKANKYRFGRGLLKSCFMCAWKDSDAFVVRGTSSSSASGSDAIDGVDTWRHPRHMYCNIAM